jgi:chaperonin GroES
MSLNKDQIIRIRPLYDRLLVERSQNQETQTAGGIYIPEQAKEKAQIGKVIAIGAGKLLQDGNIRSLSVKVGETIFFGKYSGVELGEHGEFIMLREEEVLGIV